MNKMYNSMQVLGSFPRGNINKLFENLHGDPGRYRTKWYLYLGST